RWRPVRPAAPQPPEAGRRRAAGCVRRDGMEGMASLPHLLGPVGGGVTRVGGHVPSSRWPDAQGGPDGTTRHKPYVLANAYRANETRCQDSGPGSAVGDVDPLEAVGGQAVEEPDRGPALGGAVGGEELGAELVPVAPVGGEAGTAQGAVAAALTFEGGLGGDVEQEQVAGAAAAAGQVDQEAAGPAAGAGVVGDQTGGG